MSSEIEVITSIERVVGGVHSFWRVGLTHDPKSFEMFANYPGWYHYWELDSKEEAEHILVYFLERGCISEFWENGHKVSVKREEDSRYIFVF